MFQSAVNIVIVMFILIFLGFLFERKNWFGREIEPLLTRLVLRIGMPGMVFSNIMKNYDRQMLIDGAYVMIVPFLVMTVVYFVSGFIARALRLPPEREGVFRGLFTFGNSAFMGIPVCVAIFGEASTPIILLYYLTNTLLWWLMGAPNLARLAGRRSGNMLKRLASPPLVTTLLSLTLLLLNIKPPAVLITAGGYLGNLVTPLSMLFIGCMLSSLLRKGIRWQKGYGLVLLGRFLVSPALCLPLCFGLGLPMDTLQVFCMQSGMPSQTQTSLWAREVGGDAEYAAGAIALSTLISLLMIPAYAWLLGQLT